MLGLILVNIFMLLQGKFLTSLFAKVVSIPQEMLFADSAAAMPSTEPCPNSSGCLDMFLAVL